MLFTHHQHTIEKCNPPPWIQKIHTDIVEWRASLHHKAKVSSYTLWWWVHRTYNPGWKTVEKWYLVANIYTIWAPDKWWAWGNLWPGRAEMELREKKKKALPFSVTFNIKFSFKPFGSNLTSSCHRFHIWNGETGFIGISPAYDGFNTSSASWGIHTWHHLWLEHIGFSREYHVDILTINDIFCFVSLQHLEVYWPCTKQSLKSSLCQPFRGISEMVKILLFPSLFPLKSAGKQHSLLNLPTKYKHLMNYKVLSHAFHHLLWDEGERSHDCSPACIQI